MPPSPSTVTPLIAGPLPSTALDELAAEIGEAHADHDHATLVRIRPRASGVEVGLCSLPPDVHPASALAGHVVPPPWAASGVVAPGWARPVEQAAATGTGTRTTVVMLVGRDGHVASHAVGIPGLSSVAGVPSGTDTGGGDEARAGAGAGALVGRIPDLLLRTLQLPTPAPTVTAAAWWRACWLDAVVAAAADDPARPPDRQRPLTGTLPVPLVQALIDEPALCTVAGWPRIRQLAAAPEPPPAPGPAAVRAAVGAHVDPTLATWMDDGCFSRWLLDALPTVDELLDLASGLVEPDVLALLEQVAHGQPPDPDPADPPDEPEPREGPA